MATTVRARAGPARGLRPGPPVRAASAARTGAAAPAAPAAGGGAAAGRAAGRGQRRRHRRQGPRGARCASSPSPSGAGGSQPAPSSGSASWQNQSAAVIVDVPRSFAYKIWSDRPGLTRFMPFITAITVDPDDELLSTWTLSTRAFEREWTVSWLARNLTPMKNRKIHWRSEEGSQVENRGAVRFSDAAGAAGPRGVRCELSISYACPAVLAPFAAAVGPVVDSLLAQTMRGFKAFAEGAHRDRSPPPPPAGS